MKKIFLAVPLVLALYACGDDTTDNKEEEKVEEQQTAKEEITYLASTAEWEVDERLQEPAEDTLCEMCNMKVYMKDEEMGVFSAQAVKPDGSIAFYDDIGCLLNAELAQNKVNEKFVRDYVTLNWINIEEATIVKTELKSPMNWGYIFFAYEEDANTYIAENPTAKVEELEVVKQAAKERREKKLAEKAKQEAEQNGEGQQEMDSNGPEMEQNEEGNDHAH